MKLKILIAIVAILLSSVFATTQDIGAVLILPANTEYPVVTLDSLNCYQPTWEKFYVPSNKSTMTTIVDVYDLVFYICKYEVNRKEVLLLVDTRKARPPPRKRREKNL